MSCDFFLQIFGMVVSKWAQYNNDMDINNSNENSTRHDQRWQHCRLAQMRGVVDFHWKPKKKMRSAVHTQKKLVRGQKCHAHTHMQTKYATKKEKRRRGRELWWYTLSWCSPQLWCVSICGRVYYYCYYLCLCVCARLYGYNIIFYCIRSIIIGALLWLLLLLFISSMSYLLDSVGLDVNKTNYSNFYLVFVVFVVVVAFLSL